jgi:hypothetical protein
MNLDDVAEGKRAAVALSQTFSFYSSFHPLGGEQRTRSFKVFS